MLISCLSRTPDFLRVDRGYNLVLLEFNKSSNAYGITVLVAPVEVLETTLHLSPKMGRAHSHDSRRSQKTTAKRRKISKDAKASAWCERNHSGKQISEWPRKAFKFSLVPTHYPILKLLGIFSTALRQTVPKRQNQEYTQIYEKLFCTKVTKCRENFVSDKNV